MNSLIHHLEEGEVTQETSTQFNHDYSRNSSNESRPVRSSTSSQPSSLLVTKELASKSSPSPSSNFIGAVHQGTQNTQRYELSSDELDRAKDVILDLLGWGVRPEYLVESGVSLATITRVFTDLRLRLPPHLVPVPDA